MDIDRKRWMAADHRRSAAGHRADATPEMEGAKRLVDEYWKTTLPGDFIASSLRCADDHEYRAALIEADIAKDEAEEERRREITVPLYAAANDYAREKMRD